jgi:hypothetical protein
MGAVSVDSMGAIIGSMGAVEGSMMDIMTLEDDFKWLDGPILGKPGWLEGAEG